MIIGDPNTFSIFIDVVEEWNADKSFNNGLLLFNVNGTFFPKKIIEATLNTELYELMQNIENIKENIEIFQMEKEDAFSHIYKLTFPDDYDMDNDYSYNVTPFVLWDNNCFVFMISDGHSIRILAAELQYVIEQSIHNLQEIEVAEVFISVEKLQDMFRKLKSFQMKILEN